MSGEDFYEDHRVLKDPHKETFARCQVQGLKGAESYRRAKSLPPGTPVSSTTVKNWKEDPQVAARICALQQAAANQVVKAVVYSEAWIKSNTKQLVEQGIRLRPVLDRRGEPIIDTIDGQEVPRMDMADSGAAARGLDMASRHGGLYHEKGKRDPEEERTDEELNANVKRLCEELGITAPGVGSVPSGAGEQAGEPLSTVPEAS